MLCLLYNACYFIKMEFKSVPLSVSKTDINMPHPVMVTWIIAKVKDNLPCIDVSTIKTVKHKLFSGTVTSDSVTKIVVEFMLPNV